MYYDLKVNIVSVRVKSTGNPGFKVFIKCFFLFPVCKYCLHLLIYKMEKYETVYAHKRLSVPESYLSVFRYLDMLFMHTDTGTESVSIFSNSLHVGEVISYMTFFLSHDILVFYGHSLQWTPICHVKRRINPIYVVDCADHSCFGQSFVVNMKCVCFRKLEFLISGRIIKDELFLSSVRRIFCLIFAKNSGKDVNHIHLSPKHKKGLSLRWKRPPIRFSDFPALPLWTVSFDAFYIVPEVRLKQYKTSSCPPHLK